MGFTKQKLTKLADKCTIVMVVSTVLMRYSDLFQKQGSIKEYEIASQMACYGLSQTQIADVLERDVRTIEEWLQAIGKK